VNSEGLEVFDRPRSDIWNALTDMDLMAAVIPHLQAVEETTSSSLSCRVRPGLSFLAGSIKLHFGVTEVQPDEQLRVDVEGKQMAGGLTLAIDIALSQTPVGTELKWQGDEIRRQGLLRPISQGLLRGAATRIIGQLWGNFHTALAATTT